MDRLQESYINQRVFLLNISKKIVKDESLAEDVLQDVYEKALSIELSDRLNEMTEECLLAYLVTMLKRRAYNVIRKRSYETDFTTLRWEEDFKIEDPVDVANMVVDQCMFQQVKTEIKKLSSDDEILIQLSYMYQFENKEIAHTLDMKESTVRKRLERARKRLAKLCKEHKDS